LRKAVAEMAVPQQALALLGGLLVLVGIGEVLVDGWNYIYTMHLASGPVAVASATRRRWTKPVALLFLVGYLVLYIYETTAGTEEPGPFHVGGATLVFNGIVLAALMVILMWPMEVRPIGRARREGARRRR
jgi:hypothetical protein